MLAVRGIGVITDRFEAQHPHDLLFALFAAAGIMERAHRRLLKMRRLFVGKRDESQRATAWLAGKFASQRQERRDAGAIVVGAWRAGRRIIVRADDDDLSGR